jgi:hypothetical protein
MADPAEHQAGQTTEQRHCRPFPKSDRFGARRTDQTDSQTAQLSAASNAERHERRDKAGGNLIWCTSHHHRPFSQFPVQRVARGTKEMT